MVWEGAKMESMEMAAKHFFDGEQAVDPWILHQRSVDGSTVFLDAWCETGGSSSCLRDAWWLHLDGLEEATANIAAWRAFADGFDQECDGHVELLRFGDFRQSFGTWSVEEEREFVLGDADERGCLHRLLAEQRSVAVMDRYIRDRSRGGPVRPKLDTVAWVLRWMQRYRRMPASRQVALMRAQQHVARYTVSDDGQELRVLQWRLQQTQQLPEGDQQLGVWLAELRAECRAMVREKEEQARMAAEPVQVVVPERARARVAGRARTAAVHRAPTDAQRQKEQRWQQKCKQWARRRFRLGERR